MQRLEVSGAVGHIYASLGFKGLMYRIMIVVSFMRYGHIQKYQYSQVNETS